MVLRLLPRLRGERQKLHVLSQRHIIVMMLLVSCVSATYQRLILERGRAGGADLVTSKPRLRVEARLHREVMGGDVDCQK